MSTLQCLLLAGVCSILAPFAMANPVGALVDVDIRNGSTADGHPNEQETSAFGQVAANITSTFGSGSGSGSANLSAGILRATSVAPLYGGFNTGIYYTLTQSSITDEISFSANASGTAYLDFHWDGMQSGFDGLSQGVAGLAIYIVPGGYPPAIAPEYILNNDNCYSYNGPICYAGTSIDQTGSIAFPILPGLTYIQLTLLAYPVDGGTADFSNTGNFALRLPSDVSYTSASGVFLATATPIFPNATTPVAISEPPVIALLFAGLALGTSRLRRRRDRQQYLT